MTPASTRVPATAAGRDAPVVVEGLTKRFGDFIAVDEVSFTVDRGEIFGFLGPNGAGKTTTIKMLTGLVDPSEGRATVAGHDVVTARSHVQGKIGYMSQRFSLYADLTVAENIELFSGLYGVTGGRARSRSEWVLEMAGLGDQRHRLAGQLPLGYKQRLALGTSVLHEPPILFLDEPTSGVDPLARRRFWDLIDALSRDGTTVFVSTHYMEEAEYCHRLALMNRGHLIALDTPAGLRNSMTDTVVRVRAERPAEAVERLRRAPGVVEAALFGRDVRVVLGDADPEALLGAVLTDSTASRAPSGPHRVPPAWEVARPTLEDVFVALVRAAGGARVD